MDSASAFEQLVRTRSPRFRRRWRAGATAIRSSPKPAQKSAFAAASANVLQQLAAAGSWAPRGRSGRQSAGNSRSRTRPASRSCPWLRASGGRSSALSAALSARPVSGSRPAARPAAARIRSTGAGPQPGQQLAKHDRRGEEIVKARFQGGGDVAPPRAASTAARHTYIRAARRGESRGRAASRPAARCCRRGSRSRAAAASAGGQGLLGVGGLANVVAEDVEELRQPPQLTRSGETIRIVNGRGFIGLILRIARGRCRKPSVGQGKGSGLRGSGFGNQRYRGRPARSCGFARWYGLTGGQQPLAARFTLSLNPEPRTLNRFPCYGSIGLRLVICSPSRGATMRTNLLARAGDLARLAGTRHPRQRAGADRARAGFPFTARPQRVVRLSDPLVARFARACRDRSRRERASSSAI